MFRSFRCRGPSPMALLAFDGQAFGSGAAVLLLAQTRRRLERVLAALEIVDGARHAGAGAGAGAGAVLLTNERRSDEKIAGAALTHNAYNVNVNLSALRGRRELTLLEFSFGWLRV